MIAKIFFILGIFLIFLGLSGGEKIIDSDGVIVDAPRSTPINEVKVSNDTILIGGRIGVVTCCNSMYPAIRDGNTIVMIDVPENIDVGDIVVINGTSHRIIWKNDTHVITKGDNNVWQDQVQERKNITGLVSAVIY